MASEKKDEKRGLFSWPGGFLRGEKNYWWLPFAFLFLFLAAGGFYAWNAMKGAAHSLAGGGSYTALSANSAGYGQLSSAAKEDNFFALEEAVSSPEVKKEQEAGLKAGSSRPGAAAGAGEPPATSGFSDEPGNPEGETAGYQDMAVRSGVSQSKLQARQSPFAGPGGGQTSRSTAFREEREDKPEIAMAVPAGKTLSGKVPRKGSGNSVLESLKSAFKSSIYGARMTSQDAASAWIAKGFTGAPEAQLALEYDDKMRSKLDKVNPGAIPGFLRDQDLDATEAKTLGVSEVHKPEVNKEATREALKEDKDYQAKKAAQDMASGMINPMFGGLGLGGRTQDPVSAAETEDTSSRALADPDARPELPVTVDEFGNTVVPGPNGMKYFFGEDGAILGCEDPGAGMCLMPGAGNCPSGLFFT